MIALVTAMAFMIAAVCGAGAEAAPPAGQVSFSTAPGLSRAFSPNLHDYVVRCKNQPVTLQGHTSQGWEMRIGKRPFRRGNFSEVVPLYAGQAFKVTVRRVGSTQLHFYYVRCLPNNFPDFTFTRYGPVSPQYFSVDRAFDCGDGCYGIIFNNHGVPIWWVNTPTWATTALSNGNMLWFERSFSVPGRWATHRRDGTLARPLQGIGLRADAHDLQLLPNGGHLVGAYIKQENVDMSAYGGSSNATVINAELQQVSPQGRLVWGGKSQHHIARAETGRHWPRVIHPSPRGYDIVHWNSIEPAGDSVIASFRYLDAIYKIEKSTAGRILWKLGGTRTPESLRVRNDARAYTFGAQHDARLLPDGTVTVFDNRTWLENQRPRAVRFRIDEQTHTATLLESITDPAVSSSDCCGSARRLNGGDWLIYWGPPSHLTHGYKPSGQRTFSLRIWGGYRTEPVPRGAVTAQELRQGMNAMYATP
jgi:hypothetical protein